MNHHESDPTLTTVYDWADAFREVEACLAPHFARAEARQRASAYLRGLLSPVERKNSWQLAELAGDPSPYGFQHLLGRADWDPDQLRDDLQRYIVRHLGDPEGIIVVDETGFLKKGRMSAGVARQYSGTAGRIENCQIGVFLTYVGAHGHTLLDRELYLPKEWTTDRDRCQKAGIPDDRDLITKPKLAKQMLERAFAAEIPVRWVTGDSIYGDDRSLRIWLEEREQPYVFAVSGKEYAWIGWKQHRVSNLVQELPADHWVRLSAGSGSKGPRLYAWQWQPVGGFLQEEGRRWLLVRRSISDPSAMTAYIVFAPVGTRLETVVQVAGTRWAIEDDFGTSKGEVGLDHYEVRRWTGWYRHITLAMWAHAFLSVIRAAAVTADLPKKGHLDRPSSLTTFKRQRGLSSGGV